MPDTSAKAQLIHLGGILGDATTSTIDSLTAIDRSVHNVFVSAQYCLVSDCWFTPGSAGLLILREFCRLWRHRGGFFLYDDLLGLGLKVGFRVGGVLVLDLFPLAIRPV